MGRFDLRPLRVHDAASLLLRTKQGTAPPPWFQALTDVTPAATLVRTPPVVHRTMSPSKRLKKPSRMFQPKPISYEEDDLRQEFFADHPWELARPRIINEDDGKDSQRWDWSHATQQGRPALAENVIQRQLWLRDSNPSMSKDQAYDQARKELYKQRHFEAIERRVAREEALAVGANFGMSAIEVGMHLEKKTFEKWKAWAKSEHALIEQNRSAAYTSYGDGSNTPSSNEPQLDDELDAMSPTAGGNAS